MTRDEILAAWLKAEREATEVELQVAQMGQAAADPAAAELFKRASELRVEADRLFGLLPKDYKNS